MRSGHYLLAFLMDGQAFSHAEETVLQQRGKWLVPGFGVIDYGKGNFRELSVGGSATIRTIAVPAAGVVLYPPRFECTGGWTQQKEKLQCL
jgi:hypothetical protein